MKASLNIKFINIIIPFFIIVLISGCSITEKVMMKRMNKMTNEEKMEMMTKMMDNDESGNCGEMMEMMSEKKLNDSLPMSEKASLMMPLCFDNILSTVDDDKKANYLLDIITKIVENGYSKLQDSDKVLFKQELVKIIKAQE